VALLQSPFLGADADLAAGTVLLAAERGGVTEHATVKVWQLVDAAARGNASAAVIDVRFELPDGPVNKTVSLAYQKIPTDSAETLPARLVNLTDGSTDTKSALPGDKGYWVEIDLGRDRPLGEVVIDLPADSPIWQQFEIRLYATGQRSDQARLWAREFDSDWKRAVRSTLVYRGPAMRGRFLRIMAMAPAAGPVELGEITARPLTAD
jgi:hypothetical protein